MEEGLLWFGILLVFMGVIAGIFLWTGAWHPYSGPVHIDW